MRCFLAVFIQSKIQIEKGMVMRFFNSTSKILWKTTFFRKYWEYTYLYLIMKNMHLYSYAFGQIRTQVTLNNYENSLKSIPSSPFPQYIATKEEWGLVKGKETILTWSTCMCTFHFQPFLFDV